MSLALGGETDAAQVVSWESSFAGGTVAVITELALFLRGRGTRVGWMLFAAFVAAAFLDFEAVLAGAGGAFGRAALGREVVGKAKAAGAKGESFPVGANVWGAGVDENAHKLCARDRAGCVSDGDDRRVEIVGNLKYLIGDVKGAEPLGEGVECHGEIVGGASEANVGLLVIGWEGVGGAYVGQVAMVLEWGAHGGERHFRSEISDPPVRRVRL